MATNKAEDVLDRWPKSGERVTVRRQWSQSLPPKSFPGEVLRAGSASFG